MVKYGCAVSRSRLAPGLFTFLYWRTLLMKLNHLNLSVTDVQATKAFLETYFGLYSEGSAPDRKNFAILRDDNGMVLTLMQGAPATVTYPRTFHIGFIQESE